MMRITIHEYGSLDQMRGIFKINFRSCIAWAALIIT